MELRNNPRESADSSERLSMERAVLDIASSDLSPYRGNAKLAWDAAPFTGMAGHGGMCDTKWH